MAKHNSRHDKGREDLELVRKICKHFFDSLGAPDLKTGPKGGKKTT